MPAMTVADAMVTDFPRLRPDLTVRQAVHVLLTLGWSSGLVIGTDGAPIGVFGRREVLRGLSEKTGGFFQEEELSFAFLRCEAFGSEALRAVWRSFWETPVEAVMARGVPCMPENATLARAAQRFAGEDVQVLAIARKGQIVGALTPRELVEGLASNPQRVREKPHPRSRT